MNDKDPLTHINPNDQLIRLYRKAEDYFFRAISLKSLSIDDAVTCYMTGVPVADLNIVYIKKQINTLDRILRQSKQFYDSANLGFIVIVPEQFCTDDIFKTMDYQ